METAATALPTGLSIEELLEWRPGFGVITVCVEIDPADRSEGWLIDLRNQLRSAVESGDDGHDRGRALTATAQRVLDRFEGDELPSGRCQIGFCEAAERRGRDIWTAAQMADFRTSVTYAARPRLIPLLKLLDEGAAVGAIAVSAERVHLYEWKLGALELIHDWRPRCTASTGASEKLGSPRTWPGPRALRARAATSTTQRLEHNRARFLKETGRLTADEARSRGWRRVIGFGDPEHVRELNEGAEKGTEVELAAAVDVIREERGKLLERVNAAVAEGNRRRELALIERAVEGARTPGGHGALGLIEVQRCLNEGRVDHLIVDADTEDSGLADSEDEVVETRAAHQRQAHTGRGRRGGAAPGARRRGRGAAVLNGFGIRRLRHQIAATGGRPTQVATGFALRSKVERPGGR